MGRLTSTLATENGTAVLRLAGSLDFASAPEVRSHLLEVCASPPEAVVVDCSELRFIDSTGIGLFVAAFRRLDAAGARFLLANVDGTVGKTLRLTGVDQFLPVHWMDGQPSAATG